jgi:hypothetical protein
VRQSHSVVSGLIVSPLAIRIAWINALERWHAVRAEERKDWTTVKDWTAVHAVNVSASELPAEAALVDALRKQAYPVISFVAGNAGGIVGHIMLSPVSLPDHPG